MPKSAGAPISYTTPWDTIIEGENGFSQTENQLESEVLPVPTDADFSADQLASATAAGEASTAVLPTAPVAKLDVPSDSAERAGSSYIWVFLKVVGFFLIVFIIAVAFFRIKSSRASMNDRKFFIFSAFLILSSSWYFLISENIWIPLAIIFILNWGPAFISHPYRKMVLGFYGYQGEALDSEYEAWAVDMTDRWRNARQAFFEQFAKSLAKGSGSRGANASGASNHVRVGACKGKFSSGDGSSHSLFRCGKCGHAGCNTMDCSNKSFYGNRCETCNHSANVIG